MTPAERAARQRRANAGGLLDWGMGVGNVAKGAWDNMNTLQKASMAPVPIASDIAGVLGDIQMYNEQPETRGLLNYGMTALSILPGIPSVAAAAGKKMSRAEAGAADVNAVSRNGDPIPDEGPLGSLNVVHNLSEKNLSHADGLGGLPVPSMAVVPNDRPMTGFGEISLIGNKELATPSAKNPYFRSDAYSPRYPSTEINFNEGLLKEFNTAAKPDMDALGQSYYALGQGMSIKDSSDFFSDPVILHKFLRDKGIKVDVEKYSDGRVNPYATRNIMQDMINAGHKSDFDKMADELFLSLEPEGRIFDGYTPSGNRRYKKETLDNVTKIMKGKVNAEEGLNYGIGSYRAAVTPRFKNMKEMKKAEGLLTSSDEMKDIKEVFLREYNDVMDQLSPYKTDEFSAPLDDFMVDLALGNERISDILPNLPAEKLGLLNDFNERLRNAPSAYFEGKPQRAVGIEEFSGALVPSNASQNTLDILGRRGINRIETYADEAERAAKMKLFRDVAFSLGGIGLLDYGMYGDEEVF